MSDVDRRVIVGSEGPAAWASNRFHRTAGHLEAGPSPSPEAKRATLEAAAGSGTPPPAAPTWTARASVRPEAKMTIRFHGTGGPPSASTGIGGADP